MLDSPRLKLAAQHCYDHYLSKPYTDISICSWDLNYKHIQRPNHALAHSLRGAMNAPIVIELFKKHSKRGDQFNFSKAEVEKIQIALMFRVAGRKSDAGFSDSPYAYTQYQKGHADAFRNFCKDYPDIYTEQEVEHYAKALQTYADGGNSPLHTLFRACHNIDLLRCVSSNRFNDSIAFIRKEVGCSGTVILAI